MYGQSAADHSTLGFFQSLLNRVTVDVKKAVDDSLDLLHTIVPIPFNFGKKMSCQGIRFR